MHAELVLAYAAGTPQTPPPVAYPPSMSHALLINFDLYPKRHHIQLQL